MFNNTMYFLSGLCTALIVSNKLRKLELERIDKDHQEDLSSTHSDAFKSGWGASNNHHTNWHKIYHPHCDSIFCPSR